MYMCLVPLWLAGLFSCALLLQSVRLSKIASEQKALQPHMAGHASRYLALFCQCG
jgi:hypothetical protein